MKYGKRIFAWHQWCGLVVGIFLLVMSVSGSLLAFTDELQGAYERDHLPVPNPGGKVSYDASFGRVQRLYPGWEVRVYGQPGKNEAVIYDLRKGTEMKKAFAHPVDGRVLHIQDEVQQQLHRQLLTLHYTMFAGTPGKIAVFCVGILFLLSLITGLYIYRKAVARVLLFRIQLNRRTRRSFYSSLHRVIGVWALLFNLLIVITGLFISYSIITAAFKKAPAAQADKRAGTFPIDRIIKTAGQQFPDFQIHLLRVAAGSPQVQLSGSFKEDPFYYGKYYSRLYFEGATGQLVKAERLRDQAPFKKWQSITGPLHFGNWGGLPVKILYCLLGLTPGILSISGFVIWRIRKKRPGKQ